MVKYITSISFLCPFPSFVLCKLCEMKDKKLRSDLGTSRLNRSSCQVKRSCSAFWEQVSRTVTIFSLTALKSSCRDVSFLLQCRCTSYSDCFTPATYAPGLHVWLGLCDSRNSLINSHAALWCWQKLSSPHHHSGQNEDTYLQLITQTNKQMRLWVCREGGGW